MLGPRALLMICNDEISLTCRMSLQEHPCQGNPRFQLLLFKGHLIKCRYGWSDNLHQAKPGFMHDKEAGDLIAFHAPPPPTDHLVLYTSLYSNNGNYCT